MESERNAYNRRVPLVQPEATDSDIDENDFEESVVSFAFPSSLMSFQNQKIQLLKFRIL